MKMIIFIQNQVNLTKLEILIGWGGEKKNRIQLEWWLESYKLLHGLAEFGLRGGGYYIHDSKLRNHVELHANWWLKGKVMDS